MQVVFADLFDHMEAPQTLQQRREERHNAETATGRANFADMADQEVSAGQVDFTKTFEISGVWEKVTSG